MILNLPHSKQEIQSALAAAFLNENFFEAKYLILDLGADPSGVTKCIDSPDIETDNAYISFDDISIGESAGLNCSSYHILKLLMEHGANYHRSHGRTADA